MGGKWWNTNDNELFFSFFFCATYLFLADNIYIYICAHTYRHIHCKKEKNQEL